MRSPALGGACRSNNEHHRVFRIEPLLSHHRYHDVLLRNRCVRGSRLLHATGHVDVRRTTSDRKGVPIVENEDRHQMLTDQSIEDRFELGKSDRRHISRIIDTISAEMHRHNERGLMSGKLCVDRRFQRIKFLLCDGHGRLIWRFRLGLSVCD